MLGKVFLASRAQRKDPMRKMRILLADDHPAIRGFVEALLQPTFDTIGSVLNGEDLVEAALRLQPDVIIIDISMPILSGIEAARELKHSGSGAKVIFLTVHSDSDFVRLCLEAGASGYVVKPRMDTDLLPAIHEALASRCFVSPIDKYKN
jgi:DNA-binding NarL/FixJ family response regulator